MTASVRFALAPLEITVEAPGARIALTFPLATPDGARGSSCNTPAWLCTSISVSVRQPCSRNFVDLERWGFSRSTRVGNRVAAVGHVRLGSRVHEPEQRARRFSYACSPSIGAPHKWIFQPSTSAGRLVARATRGVRASARNRAGLASA